MNKFKILQSSGNLSLLYRVNEITTFLNNIDDEFNLYLKNYFTKAEVIDLLGTILQDWSPLIPYELNTRVFYINPYNNKLESGLSLENGNLNNPPWEKNNKWKITQFNVDTSIIVNEVIDEIKKILPDEIKKLGNDSVIYDIGEILEFNNTDSKNRFLKTYNIDDSYLKVYSELKKIVLKFDLSKPSISCKAVIESSNLDDASYVCVLSSNSDSDYLSLLGNKDAWILSDVKVLNYDSLLNKDFTIYITRTIDGENVDNVTVTFSRFYSTNNSKELGLDLIFTI